MTAEQLAYLEWINQYTGQEFKEEDIPAPIELAIDKMIAFDANDTGVKSESLGDYSVTRETEYPKSILKLIQPYRRVKFR